MKTALSKVTLSQTALPLAALFVGLCIAVVSGLWSKHQIDYNEKTAFDLMVQRVSDNIMDRFFNANYGLGSTMGLYAANLRVSRKEFQAYVMSRHLPKKFPGVRGLGFIEHVSRDELNAFVAAERADNAPQFSVHQLEDKSLADLYVIKFIEPAFANPNADGLDVGSEPRRRAALLRAIDTGEATMTQAITLVQDSGKTPGVLLFLPVYKTATFPVADERRAALLGLLYMPIVLSELLDAVPDFVSKQIDFELVESSATGSNETIYYDADNHLAKPVAGRGAKRTVSQSLPLFGQTLTLRVSSLPAFEAGFDSTAPWFIFVTLSLLSVLTALLLRLQASGLQRSELRAMQMTEKLRQDQARWHDFSTGASDWFWETDAEHFFRFVSDNIESFYGLHAFQLVGISFKILLETDTFNSPDLITEQLQKLESHLPLNRFEYQAILTDGSIRWIVLSATPQFDANGRFCGYRGNGRDITDRKRAEIKAATLSREVSLLSQRLTLATDSAQIGVWDWAIPEDKLDWNKWMYTLYGVLPEDFSGAYTAWRAGLHPDDASRGDAEIAQALSDEKVFDTEFRVVWRNGEVHHLKAAALVLRDECGVPQRMIGINYDITGHKRIEANLALARLQADSANLAKTDFLANMSHEIRTPLNAILGLAYLLEQSNLEHEAHSMVRKIRASGRVLLSLISDILDMSKIEAGQMRIEHAPFRLGDVIDNLAVALGVSVGDKNIELVISPLPAGVVCIFGDVLRLEQVLINLVSNAIKFTQTGSIEVRAEVISSADSPSMLRFSVTDTGIGIAPELQIGIFSAFTQADTSTTRRFGGTGLGLTICCQLVSLMGGEMGVISSPGNGSEFWFTLPLLQADDSNPSSPSMVDVSVLIADDSDLALKAIADMAMGFGWRVSSVDSGTAALTHVLERKQGGLPDVVVLDWQMPGMDGLVTARLIREIVSENECPIVIMANSSSHTSLSAMPGAELVDAILHKPVTSSGLYNAVIEAQSRRSAKEDVTHVLPQATSDSLSGLRVLVVDDSDINREVAQRILVSQAAVVSLAEDGQQAIDWLLANTGEIDIVLMDVQMPVLDGIEATRRLRRMPQFEGLPIVALTAGAFKSQHDAALAAGMTHFVSKPFDVPSTIALIQRLCRSSKLSQTPAAVPIPIRTPLDSTVSTVATVSPTVTQILDVTQGMALLTDAPTYQSYLRRFVNDYSEAAVVIQTSLEQGMRASAAALAHKLSGVAANLAMTHTRNAAQALEQVLVTDFDPSLALAQLKDSLAAVVAEINRVAPPEALDSPNATTPFISFPRSCVGT